jgi:MoaA/NifB/PqqE/SkfB family radical SAM enzyme
VEDNRQTKYLKSRFCPNPFERFEISDKGEVFVCCPSYLPKSIGNIYDSSVEEIWNSEAASEIRASILDGTFKYCSRTFCGDIASMSLPPKQETSLPPMPPKIHLSYDPACNLSCPSCRKSAMTCRAAQATR